MESVEHTTTTSTTITASNDSRLDKQVRFIELRAQGQPYRTIAKELQVSKATLTGWDKQLAADIAKHKAERMQELYTTYGMYKEARIQKLGGVLQKIDSELDTRDWSDITTDKLLDYKLKYTQALSSEYTPITGKDRSSQELNAATILKELDNLLERVQSGEVHKDQAQQELVILSGMMRVYEASALEDKVKRLERAIAG